MLSTSNLSAAQAETYYTKEDYYSKEEKAHPTKWVGKGAVALGLSGEVKQQDFSNLLVGKSPDGQSLTGRVVVPEKRRAGTDFTFSAPKSVSIAALVQQDERVLAAHHQAVSKALSVLEERYAQTRVSTPTGRRKVTTGNLTAAVFTHSTSREAEPQLHSHCVVINATQLPDGRWFSFSNEAAIASQKLLGQIYQNELALALKQHGYEIEPKAHGQFELKGYSPELLKSFSTRRQQILKLIEEWEATGAENNRALRETATLMSRKRKPKEVDEGLLQRGWNALIQLKGLELPDLPEGKSQLNQVSTSAQAVVDSAIQHCGERESVFRRTKLERFVFELQLGGQSFDEIQGAISTHPELIQVEKDKFTTQAALNLELNTIRLMRQGRGAVEPIAPTATVECCLRETSLNTEQMRAVAIAATTPDQVMAWQGVAGAGKTYALNTLKELAQDQGYTVRGFAPSAEAAHGLGEALGIETETVAGLLVSQPPDQLQRSALWIVDEAGLLSMKDAHALLRRARLEQARVLLVGDTRQLSAVEAGNPFKSLQAGGITTAYLEIHRRQQSKVLRSAVEKVAQGQIAEGIQLLEQADCLKELVETEERSHQIALDYLTLPAEEREKTLVLTGTNQERLELTQRIRAGLQTEGLLGSDSFILKGLRRKDLTTAQSSYVTAYAPGDVLVPVQDYRKQGLLRGEQYTVLSVDKDSHQLALETPSGAVISVDPALCLRKTVYITQTIPIAVGDKLRWTRNNPKTGVRNGQAFVVKQIEVDGKAEIVNAEGKTRRISLNGKQYVDYAWVSTTYSSQGKTANRVLALLGETTHREAFYVAISRAKYGLTLYTSSREELTRLAQASRAKENVSDYAPLFEQVGEYEQRPQNLDPVSNIDYRAVGERIGRRIAEQLAAVESGNPGEHRTSNSLGAGRAGFEQGFEELAAALEPYLEPLAGAIANYRDQRDLLRCAEDLADAAEAINLGLVQVEQLAKNRVELTAVVDRLNQTLGAKVGQLVSGGEFDSGRSREQPSALADVPGKATKAQKLLLPDHEEKKARRANLREADSQSLTPDLLLPTPDSQESTQLSPRQHYQQMWARYNQGVEADTPVRLDYRVCRRAFEDGQSFKDVGLMLAAGSPYVQWMAQTQGKEKSRVYVNQTARQACQKEKGLTRPQQRKQERQLEM